VTDDKLSSSNQGKTEPVAVSPTRPTEQPTADSADPQARQPEDEDAVPDRVAESMTAGTHPASQAVVGRANAPDGEVAPH